MVFAGWGRPEEEEKRPPYFPFPLLLLLLYVCSTTGGSIFLGVLSWVRTKPFRLAGDTRPEEEEDTGGPLYYLWYLW